MIANEAGSNTLLTSRKETKKQSLLNGNVPLVPSADKASAMLGTVEMPVRSSLTRVDVQARESKLKIATLYNNSK